MRKVVIVDSDGRPELSEAAKKLLDSVGLPTDSHIVLSEFTSDECRDDQRVVKRDDPMLVSIVEELGHDAVISGRLIVIEIPDDVDWEINGGFERPEWVAEPHRRWGRECGVGPFKPPQ